MRFSILAAPIAAALALALAACGGKNQAENTTNAEEGLAAQSIVSNDVTAIDAVTGDASNMAADVNYTEALNTVENAGAEKMPNPRKAAPGKPPLETPTPATQAATNNAAE